MSSLCHVVSAIFPPGQKGKTLREGVVIIDFGMNLLDVCCRNESLTATLLLKSRLVISLSLELFCHLAIKQTEIA